MQKFYKNSVKKQKGKVNLNKKFKIKVFFGKIKLLACKMF